MCNPQFLQRGVGIPLGDSQADFMAVPFLALALALALDGPDDQRVVRVLAGALEKRFGIAVRVQPLNTSYLRITMAIKRHIQAFDHALQQLLGSS